VKPPPFDYLAPSTLDEALALRAEHADDSLVLAGGQSAMPLLSLRMALPGAVIDLGRIPELAGIREFDGGVAFGAMTRQRDAERSQLVQERLPLATQALAHVGHTTIRNRGTIGGTMAHADPAAELPAVALLLDGELVARSTRGERTIAARDFFVGVLTTALEPDELLVEVRLPGLAGRVGTSFLEVARRHGDFAVVAAGAAVVLAGDGTIADARLAFTGVGATAVRAYDAEATLRGAQPGDDVFAEAAARAAAELEPGSDAHATAAYRRRIADVLARRALKEATP
jgi:CO/xanthine dehydrogenase FAD-binding subunit